VKMAPGFFLIALMLDVTAMITDVKTFGEFVAAGGVRSLISTLEAPDILRPSASTSQTDT
jgi:hypothetical protein